MRFVDILSLLIVIAGGLNSGMMAYCGCDVLELTFGYQSLSLRIAHAVVGAAALYLVVASRWIARRWRISGSGLTDSFLTDCPRKSSGSHGAQNADLTPRSHMLRPRVARGPAQAWISDPRVTARVTN